jgi:hypothetical protein
MKWIVGKSLKVGNDQEDLSFNWFLDHQQPQFQKFAFEKTIEIDK